jgi:predicted dehydrogenase
MSSSITRRRFVRTTAVSGPAFALTALNYSRVLGANDRISIGLIGCGDRGVNAHLKGISPYIRSENIELSAVCDPWSVAREKASATVKEDWGREPRAFVSHRELLSLKEVDAVMIASCDHQHARQLEAAANAGKDVYCEKPLARNLTELRKAVDAVKRANAIVQVGTQLRSLPSFRGCREVYQSGILGKVTRIEQCRNGSQPYWYRYLKPEVKKEELDWGEFWMGKPKLSFDPILYSGWYGYRYFSDGPVPGFASHFTDLVHFITGAQFPSSCVCQGGTFLWNDDHHFTCPDQVQASWIYPEGFMVSYSTNFGNDYGNSFKAFGDQGVLKMEDWNAPVYTAEGGSKNKGVIRGINAVKEIEGPDHFLDWLQCLRSRRAPHAPIAAGYQHAVACIMAVESFNRGRRTHYDSQKCSIRYE